MIVEPDPGRVTRYVGQQRRDGKTVGVVPTMGALHDGHGSLIEVARRECDVVVTTIFVNPTQFGPNEDFDRYPRTLDADLDRCRRAGADLVFTPERTAMYPDGAQTVVAVTELSTRLEGAIRPGHFDGVTTIVAKLFHITLPDRAYFGQKDFQQQLVIRQMVRDLNFPLEVITCPTIREADGLAMSSRNRYLSPDERRTALHLSRVLRQATDLAGQGSEPPEAIAAMMRNELATVAGLVPEYAEVLDSETLGPVQTGSDRAVALVAARVGSTRLIDNTILEFRSSD